MKPQLLETPSKDGEGGGGLQVEKGQKATVDVQNHLDLKLGISLNSFGDVGSPSDVQGGGGGGQRFPAAHSGRLGYGGSGYLMSQRSGSFVDPWSLAARQEKAVFEQRQRKSNPPSTLMRAPPPPPSVVGWPPVRAFRKNLVSQQLQKTDMDAEKDAKKIKVVEEPSGNNIEVIRPATMFVKVNMDGYGVGRKINLMAHDGYESLSRALQKLFHNFLSVNYSNNMEQDDEDNEADNSDYILLYEDHEGDRMLVGDVPWEMFVSSVKRLYIASSTRTFKDGKAKPKEEHNER